MQIRMPAYKFLVVGLVSLLIAESAMALTQRSGEYTCNRLGEQKYQCLRIIRDRYVDEWASGACDRYTNIDHTLTCMDIIVNDRFQKNAVVACDRFSDSTHTNDCLASISNCSFAPEHISECDRLTTTQGTIDCFRYYCSR